MYRQKSNALLSGLLILMLLFMSGLTALAASDGSGTGTGDGGGTKPPTLESAYLATISNNTSTAGASLGSNMKLSTNPPTIRIKFATNVVDDTIWSNNKGCFSMRKVGSTVPITVSRIDSTINFAERNYIFIEPKEALSSGSYTIQIDGGLKSKNGVSNGSQQSVSFSVASSTVEVTSIMVKGKDNASTVANGKTLQMNATVLPGNASDPSVTWSVASGTGAATISSSGLLTGTKAGTVTVTAKAKDGSGVKGSKAITVTVPEVAVTSIAVSGNGSASTLVNGKTLQMNAAVKPGNASDPSVTWSVTSGTGTATISSGGLLKGTKVGTVTVTATAKDDSGIKGSKTITVTAPEVAVTSITVSGNGSASTLVNGKTLQMNAAVKPDNASDPSVTWSVTSGTGTATISSGGLLKGTKVGTVTVTAQAKDGSGIRGSQTITVTAEEVTVTGISVSGQDNASTVVNGKTLQMNAVVLPDDASDTSVIWSVTPGTGSATIDPATGLLTGTAVGTVTVTATNEASSVQGSTLVTVAEPLVPPVMVLSDINGCWAETNIKVLVDAGAISGYADGSFKPDTNISRAEFAVVLVKAFNLEAAGGKVFIDTAGHWAQDYIATVQALSVVNGYNNDYFGPNDLITREQMAVMIVAAAKLEALSPATTFSDDNEISAWAKSGINTAVANQIISGYPDNTFKPQGSATRAEAVTAIVMTLK